MVSSLQDASLMKCIEVLLNMRTMESSYDLEVAQQYVCENYPVHIQQKILKKIHYQQSSQITLIFLPFLLNSKKLYLTDQNIGEVVQWLEAHPELEERLCSLYRLSVNISSAVNYFIISNLLNKITGLRIFQLFSCTSDEILARIGMSCKNIEVFDSRDDAASTVTDAGLAFLSHCRNLQVILFSNIADEYDYEDKFRFSAKGVAMLLYALPKLKRFECPEYLLRDAFQFLYQMNFSKNNSLSLSSLNISFPDIPSSTIGLLPYLCPNISILSLYITNKELMIVSNALKRLLYLSKLQLNIEGIGVLDQLGISGYGNRLKCLVIRTPSLTESEISLLYKSCTNLEILVLQVHNHHFDGVTINFNTVPLFTKLTSLELFSRVPVRMIVILNTHVTSLKALYMSRITTEGLVTAVQAIIANGGWSCLEIMVLPAFSLYNSDFINSILVACPRLKLMAVSFANRTQESEVKEFIKEYKHPVRICDYDDIIPPSKQFDPVYQ